MKTSYLEQGACKPPCKYYHNISGNYKEKKGHKLDCHAFVTPPCVKHLQNE